MSTHIGAAVGDIAEIVLLPGDPYRARHIAETFFESPTCHNEVRGMLGYTGTYMGRRVSVQGTGMGIPSISIYAHELLADYGAKTLIRVGTCGAMQPDVKVRDVILAVSASTDSATNHVRFPNVNFAPTASFDLVQAAYQAALMKQLPVKVGSVFTTDTFYSEDSQIVERLAKYGVLAVEMEAAALYTLSAQFGAKALAVLTVSDHLITGEQTSANDRQSTFNHMIELALEAAIRATN